MKNSRLILSAAVAIGAMLGTGAASAADMAVRTMPYAAPAPVFSWTGCYVGVHAGAGVMLDQGFQSGAGITQDMRLDRHGAGGLAGGQLGCNYQTGMLVLGIEGEGFWSGMKVSADRFGGLNGNILQESGSVKNKWDYDIAARFGIAIDRALVFGKAGWVAGRFDWNAADVNCGTLCTVTQGNATLDGLLIGLGLEYAFTNNWTTKFEYDYLGFGSRNVVFRTTCLTPAFCGPSGSVTTTQNVSADKHIFKVGVNYKFF
ncbi:MAG TPA: outer membrane beta-barrel protein [Bradyrhizobium sp.]|jgi:outer membrane immunogenic protein|nr:outer membrane beta-barrel protein [Bradyrhizobium sp.]